MSAFDTVGFHERAVRTASHEDVSETRELLVETLEDQGVGPRVDDAGNVLASRGSGEGPHLALNTHIDTVPPHVEYDRDGDVVSGRGACDAKGPLAALLDAFLACEPGDGRVTLAVTPDEETVSTGAAALDLDADGYVVGEPTGLDVCTAARGRFEGTVSVGGVAAHAAEPESGVNAVAALAPLFRAVETFDDEHGPGQHAQLGGPTLTVTAVEGGEATNQVPAECRFTLDRRSVPPETADGFAAEITGHLRAHAPESVAVEFALKDRPTSFLEAWATDPDAPLVRELVGASGGAARPFTAATEASYFAGGAPTVVFGPGVLADEEGAVAHAEREYVRLSAVEEAATAVRRALDALLG
ncbi:succinyl-diaminopimelate desuccinylase [Halobacteriales archaeon QS_5_70_15]|nr:MAG: succinyl-diaminopimelate desuccinylase [Halobacteriales archaeon QS_5_70_15]